MVNYLFSTRCNPPNDMQGHVAGGGVLVKRVLLTCMCAYVLDVVALAVGEIGALVAGVQLAGKVIAQMFPPVVLAHGGVWTQSALEDPEGADRTTQITIMLQIKRSPAFIVIVVMTSVDPLCPNIRLRESSLII